MSRSQELINRIKEQEELKDIYIGWYDKDKDEVFVALWKRRGKMSDFDDAQDEVDTKYGRYGTVMMFDPKMNIKKAKDRVRQVVQGLKK